MYNYIKVKDVRASASQLPIETIPDRISKVYFLKNLIDFFGMPMLLKCLVSLTPSILSNTSVFYAGQYRIGSWRKSLLISLCRIMEGVYPLI